MRPIQRTLRVLPLALALLAGASGAARATEDTDTPGHGKWEINLNVSGERTASGWEFVAPETEFNLGWGERTQLVLGLPYMTLREKDGGSRSGWGAPMVGLKYRLLDQEASGFSLAVFPMFSQSPSRNAVRRGLADPGANLVLPLIFGVRSGDTALFAEAGRVLVEKGPNEWLAGAKLTHQCHAAVECRVEVQHNLVPRQAGHTLGSIGFKWSLAQDLILQGSVGRDIGPSREEKHEFAFKFGIQIFR